MMWRNIQREKIPWFPTIDEKKCTACKTCFEFCPHSVYQMEGTTAKVDHPYQCVVGCSNCQSLCPQGAISFPDIKEIKAFITDLKRDQPRE
ncbi:MAG: 4Fe-4S binding protein [Theionarchaea archaeon]|nr:4Fe-4S binding protein [Theionarchaea archaeon]MBU7038031.1 4Fe-4S binding protein [Theionarchaea archaeon]